MRRKTKINFPTLEWYFAIVKNIIGHLSQIWRRMNWTKGPKLFLKSNVCSLFPTGGSKLPQNRRQQVFPNGTLIINTVDRNSDEGSYRCIAENKDGETAFRDVGVKVLGESIFQSEATSQHTPRTPLTLVSRPKDRKTW